MSSGRSSKRSWPGSVYDEHFGVRYGIRHLLGELPKLGVQAAGDQRQRNLDLRQTCGDSSAFLRDR